MTRTTSAPSTDLLAQAIDQVRPYLRRDLPLRDRLRAVWAGAAAAIDLAAPDRLEDDFIELARTTGLAADLGKHTDGDLRHVIAWAMRGLNPFGGAA